MDPMSLKKHKLYMLSYVILMITSMLYMYSEFNSVNHLPEPTFVTDFWWFGIVAFIVIHIALFCISVNHLMKITMMFFMLFLFILGVIGAKSLNLTIICMSFLIINSDFVVPEKFIKTDLIIRILCFASVLTLFYLDFFPAQYDVNIFRGNVIRSSLGFNHPNSLGGYYLYMIISFLLFYLNSDRVKKLSKIGNLFLVTLVFVSGYFVEFVYADSRSSQVAFLIILIFTVPIFINKNIKSPQPYIGILTLMIVSVVSIVIVFYYDPLNPMFEQLNKLTSNRLVLQNEAIKFFGFGLFNTSGFSQGNPFWVDNQYTFNLISTGIVGSILYTYIYCKSFVNSRNANNYILYIILIALILKGSFESTLTDYYAMMPIVYSFIINNKSKISHNYL